MTEVAEESDRLGDQEAARMELDALAAQDKAKDKNIFRFDDGDTVDYRLPPDTSFADSLEADERGYKPITWTQLKKKFCFERPAHKFKLVGDISAKDMTHWERSKSVKVRDSDGVEGAIFFYDEESKPYFDWDDVCVGNEVEIRSPRFHRFMDSQEGMRVESNKSIGYVRKRRFTDDMRIDYGRQNKDSGNKLFAEKKYENALSAYDQALNHLEGTFYQKPELEREAKELAAACYLNIAAVRIAERKWNLVEGPCEKALIINASPAMNAKAYFRLGQAFMEQGEWSVAGERLARAIELVPGDKRITEELDKLQAVKREFKESQKALFSAASIKKNQKSDFGFRENLLTEAPTHLENVCCFRDLGGMKVVSDVGDLTQPQGQFVYTIRQRLLYRSSNFSDASKSDLATLMDPFGMKTIIDLRNNRETESYIKSLKRRLQAANRDDAVGLVDFRTKFFPMDVSCSSTSASTIRVTASARKQLEAYWPLLSKKLDQASSTSADGDADKAVPSELPRRGSKEERELILKHCRVVFGLDLATRSILSLLSWWRLIVVFVMGALFLIQRASKMVVRNTARRVGPLNLYLTILEKQKPELSFLFNNVLCDANSYPLVVSCSLGKDRTGVVVALLLSVCGVSEEAIATDYARTGDMLSPGLKEMNEELGLSAEWSETKPELMISFLSIVREKYGGVNKYLNSIGVDDAALNRIRNILVVRRRTV